MLRFRSGSYYLNFHFEVVSLRFLQLFGVRPWIFLKSRLKWLLSPTPKLAAISLTLRRDLPRSFSACLIFKQRTYCFGERDVSALNNRMKWPVDSLTCLANSR